MKNAVKKLATMDPVEARIEKEDRASDKRTIDNLVDQLREARAREAFVSLAKKHSAPPRILAREKSSGLREMTAVALLSDLHVEEPVTPESVQGRNEYNMEIADIRMKRFFDGLIWNVKHHRASKKVVIRDLVLWLGGDLMSGFIHEDLIQSNALSPTETMIWLLPRLRNGIAHVLKELDLDLITIPCSYGNHGRTTPKTRIQNGANNSYEWLLYNVLANEFKALGEKRVRFEITASPHQYVQAYEFTLHFHHGDSVRYLGGVGGLSIPVLKAKTGWDQIKHAHYTHLGHFHQITDLGRVLVNGSLIGYGAYSQWIRAGFEQPAQMFYLLDKNRGKTQVAPIWVSEHVS